MLACFGQRALRAIANRTVINSGFILGTPQGFDALEAVVTLSALWQVPGVPNGDGDGHGMPGEVPTYESLSSQMPALLVRESSTLFRQVSARTLSSYNKLYGRLDEEEDEGHEKGGGKGQMISSDDALGEASDRSGIDLENCTPASTAPEGEGVSPPLSTPVASPAVSSAGRLRVPGSPLSRGGSWSRMRCGSGSGASSAVAGGDAAVSGDRTIPGGSSPRAGPATAQAQEPSPRGTGTPCTSSRRASPGSSQDAEAAGGIGLDTNDAPCWVCFADKIQDEAVLLHCGHAGLCLECADNLWRRQLPCPMCRQRVTLVAQVGNVQARNVDGKMVVSPQLPREPPALPGRNASMNEHDQDERPLGDDEA